MDDAEVVVLKLFVPPYCPSYELPWRLLVCKVLVVCFYHEGFSGPNEIRSPVVNGLHHS
jgi:hypothetical protein